MKLQFCPALFSYKQNHTQQRNIRLNCYRIVITWCCLSYVYCQHLAFVDNDIITVKIGFIIELLYFSSVFYTGIYITLK